LTGRDYRAALTQHAEKFATQVLAVFGGELTGRNQTPDQARDRFPALVHELRQCNGPRVALTLVTDSATGYDVAGHVSRWGAIVSDPAIRPWVASIVLVNEIGHPTQRAFSQGELLDLRAILMGAGYNGPIALGALLDLDELSWAGNPYGYKPDVYPPLDGLTGNVFGSIHLNRGKKPSYREALRIYEQFKVRRKHSKPVSNHEPGRWDHDELRTPSDPNGHLVFSFLNGAAGSAFGLMTMGHSSRTRDVQPLEGLELDCMRAFIAGHSALPRGTYHFENANNTNSWPGSPIANAAFVEGPASSGRKSVWRAYAVRHNETGQWYAILGGPNIGEPDLRFQNGFTRIGDRIAGIDNQAGVFPLS
jgi:hypothetical protein